MRINKRIEQLREAASSRGLILFEINFRKAGVGITWSNPARLGGEVETVGNYREALVVYSYYDSLEDAIRGEIKRMKKSSDEALL